MAAANVFSIDSPDARWRGLKTLEKLAVKDAVMRDCRVSGPMGKLYDVLFKDGWTSRRVTGKQAVMENLAAAVGQPLSTMKRSLYGLRRLGYVAGRRHSHLTVWILNPSREELAADPVRGRHRAKWKPPEARLRGPDGRFVVKSDIPLVDHDVDHTWNITQLQTADSTDKFSGSSSNEEKSSDSFKVEVPEASPDDESVPEPHGRVAAATPFYEGEKVAIPTVDIRTLAASKAMPPLPKPPRDAWIEWFQAKYAQEKLSKLDVDQIENWLAQYNVTWFTFLHTCKSKCTGTSTNPIGLVKRLAKDWPVRTGTVRIVTVLRGVGLEPPDQWHKRTPCPTCNGLTGRLPDKTPCPDCQMGQDLARVEGRTTQL
jgi:hypothetical protein